MALLLKPVPRRPAGILKRMGPQPKGERLAKKVRTLLPKSLEVIGIDLNPVQGVSPMVRESSTDIPIATPIGMSTSQLGRFEASSSKGNVINSSLFKNTI